MPVKKYRSEIVSVLNPFGGIYTLKIKSLNGKFKYHPGQFLHLSLDSDYDGCGQWPESRCFSMQSNADEEDIKLTYSVKGKFTKQMEEQLQVGSKVWLKLPYGDLFTQPHDKTGTVFIAGGTGITPFLSLFTHHSFKEYVNPRIYLGFRSKSYNIYTDDLNLVKHCDPIIYYEDVDGLLNMNDICSETGTGSDYFISGPPAMIKAFKQELIANGVKANRILTDEWE